MDARLRGFPEARRLGEGAESQVYALSDELVLRLPRGGSEQFWQRRQSLCDELARHDLGFATPVVRETGRSDGLLYLVERRIPGRSLLEALATLSGRARNRAFDAYHDAACALHNVHIASDGYGELLADGQLRTPSWSEFLVRRAAAGASGLPVASQGDLPDIGETLNRFTSIAAAIDDPAPGLVHGDYFPGNVLVDDDGSVTGVVDFANLTFVGDGSLDAVGAVTFLDVIPSVTDRDRQRLRTRVAQVDPAADERFDVYRAFYALCYLHAAEDDPPLYRWCVDVLRDF